MKIIYMGTPDFAVVALESLIKSKHEIVAVVTQPDKPKGRGKKVQYTPVKEVALNNNIDVLQPNRIKDEDALLELKAYDADCIVVAAYGQILPKELLDMPKYGCINIHASLLPKLRGAAPIHWSIVNGEEETGITIMQMDVGLDTGDMIDKEATPIENKTVGELHDELAIIGGDLVIKSLEKIENGTATYEKQDDSLASYAKMLDKNTGLIDWNNNEKQIDCLVRGMNPFPCAFTMYGEKKVKIFEVEILETNANTTAGKIIDVTKNGMMVATGGNDILVKRLQFPNKKAVTVDEYIRGNEINKNIILGE